MEQGTELIKQNLSLRNKIKFLKDKLKEVEKLREKEIMEILAKENDE